MPVLPPLRAILFLLPLLAALAAVPAGAAPPAGAQAAETPAAIVGRCRSSDFAKERECYAAALDARLAAGPAAALQLLGSLAALDPDVRRDGHMYAHRIGIEALKSPEEVGKVFASCTPEWQSGCYHGVIQSYFLAMERAGRGVTPESVNAVCADARAAGNSFLLFQCTHGLGHGLTMLHRHDLPQALRSCDLLALEPEREMCHAGAFMENIVDATQPHAAGANEAASGAGGHGGHGGHGGPAADAGHGSGSAASAATAPAFRALDPADLHYPCSAMGEKYLIPCYTIQTSAMLHHTNHDVGRVAAECGRAPEKARATCFLSLGRDVSTLAAGSTSEAIRMCGLADAAFRPVCHRGVVESLVNMNADPAEGIPYCKALPEPDSKRACYAAVGLQALVLTDGEARREKACREAEAGMAEVCLGGPAADPQPM